MKFKKGQLVKLPGDYGNYSPGDFLDPGICIVVGGKPSTHALHSPLYSLWSTKMQTKIHLYEHQLSPMNPQGDESEV